MQHTSPNPLIFRVSQKAKFIILGLSCLLLKDKQCQDLGLCPTNQLGLQHRKFFFFFFLFLWTKYKSLEKPVKTIKCRHGAVFSEFTKIKFLPPNLTSGNHQEVTWNTFVAWPLELQHCPRYNTADSAQLPEMHLHTYMHAHILHTAWGEY